MSPSDASIVNIVVVVVVVVEEDSVHRVSMSVVGPKSSRHTVTLAATTVPVNSDTAGYSERHG